MWLFRNRKVAHHAVAVERYFFPRRLEVPPHVNDRLSEVYPTVDWEEVDFYRGWPHVMRRSGYQAITLPDPHSIRRINVYFTDNAWRPDTRRGMATIIHEGYHVLQVQEMGRYGVGLVRPFTIAYLAGWAGCGFSYSAHPMEHAAYRIAGHRTARFEREFPMFGPEEAADEPDFSPLAQDELEHTFWEELDRALPESFVDATIPRSDDSRHPRGNLRGAAARILSVAYATASGTAALLLWLLFLIIEGAGFVASFSLKLAAALFEHAARPRNGE